MKSYEQFCGLARALDIVGDRWTLLIVRDLMINEATFGELQIGLPGIATNILAERLRRLEDDGLVWRRKVGRVATYGLNERGRELAEVVHALIRWGAPEMARGAGDDHARVEWLAIALRALTRPSATEGRLVFQIEDRTVTLDVQEHLVSLNGTGETDDVVVRTSIEGVLAVMSGTTSLRALTRAGGARCHDVDAAEHLIRAATSAEEAARPT